MRKISILFTIAIAIVMVSACDLTERQKASADRSMVFGSATGLELYCNYLYDILPDAADNGMHKSDNTADWGAKNSSGTYECAAYTEETATSWSWSDIRHANYLIKYNTDQNLSEEVRNNYTGIAKFFRAYLYFGKLVKYGEVPWIDEPLEPTDSRLYAGRDSRDTIIRHIMDDCDYAYKWITTSSITPNSNTINKWTPLLLKSRACLFEASWRKYHAGTDYVKNCTMTADELFKAAADAAQTIMDDGPYKIHTGTAYANGRGSYRDLFISDNAVTEEVMLSYENNETSLGEMNWWLNSSTYGPHLCMTRPFAKTYLNLDGTVYDEKNADGTYKDFKEETTGRDLRLNQTIRGYDYTRKDASGNYVTTSANFTGHTLTGYQFTKYVIDDMNYDDKRSNTNDVPIMRYAEVLLNYAEAKAELGTLTDEDWKNTIGVLRRRAGITGGDLDKKPTAVDTYLQQTYYSDITDPVILEIRRDRAIELCLEGTRLRDLKRWACGNLWGDMPWTGVYVPAMDQPLDMNGDGEYDAYFTDDKSYSGEYKSIAVIVNQSTDPLKLDKLSDDPAGGYVMDYKETSHAWKDNMYLYPIPTQVGLKNPNLSQNPGWTKTW